MSWFPPLGVKFRTNDDKVTVMYDLDASGRLEAYPDVRGLPMPEAISTASPACLFLGS